MVSEAHQQSIGIRQTLGGPHDGEPIVVTDGRLDGLTMGCEDGHGHQHLPGLRGRDLGS